MIKKLFINNIVSISHIIVTNKDVDISFPPPSTKSSVQLSVGKHWIRKVQSNPLPAVAGETVVRPPNLAAMHPHLLTFIFSDLSFKAAKKILTLKNMLALRRILQCSREPGILDLETHNKIIRLRKL